MEGILTYINKLEVAQKQSNREGNPITDPTLLLFASNAMLRTDRFSRANEIWEDLPSDERTWARWKTIYRKAEMADKVKNSAKVGQDHFGAHGAFDKVPTPEAPEALPQLSVEELDGYFHPLANASTTKKDILAALVKSNATLTTSNATLMATVENLQKQLANLGKTPPPPPREQQATPDLPELQEISVPCDIQLLQVKENSHMRHPGWRSRLL